MSADPDTAIGSDQALPHDPFQPLEGARHWLDDLTGLLLNWLANHWLELTLAIAAGFVLYLGFSAVRRWASARAHSHPDDHRLATIALRVIGRTSRFFRLMLAIVIVATYTPIPERLYHIFAFLFTVSAAFQAAIWAREIILGWIERRTMEDGTRSETLENAMSLIRVIVNVIVFAIALIVVLDNLGVNVTGLVAGLGIGGIAIGLAAQGIFSDLFAALSIIFDKPFRRGEVIAFDTMTATVEKIGLKSTRLRAMDGQEVIVSNTDLLAKQIENMTKLTRRRAHHMLGLIYQTPVAKLRALPGKLVEIVERHEGVVVRAGFVGFNASSIDFELLYDVMSPDFADLFDRRQRIAFDILELFEKEGYEFAYPTQTTFTAAPDGEMIMPYPQVMPITDIGAPDKAG